MRSIFVLAFAALALHACQTDLQGARLFSYTGTGDGRYADERLSAEAIVSSGTFAVSCRNGQILFRSDTAEALLGDCERYVALPTLDRQRVLSSNSAILMSLHSMPGVVNEGTILRADGERLVAIPIESIERFGDVVAENRVIIHGGVIDDSACGMTLWTKELTLDWERGTIASERLLSRAPARC